MSKGYEWLLALRYLRSRRDEKFVSLISWSSSLGVAIGVMALIVVLSVMNGAAVEIRDKILGFSSHVDVQGPGDTITDWQDWLQRSESLSDVELAAPYIISQVLLNRGKQSVGALLKGVDAQRAGQISEQIREGGRFIQNSDDNLFEAVVGKDLARKLGLDVGDSVRVISPSGGVSPSGMAPRMRSFKVVGIFDSGFYEYDAGVVIVPLKALQKLNRLGDEVSGIEIFLKDRDTATLKAMELRTLLPVDAWVTDWTQRNRSFFKALKMERRAMAVILSLIVLVAVINMVASLVMVVMERRKEIAILKTVGATHASVMRIFVLMGAILTGCGVLLGAMLGLLLAWKLDVVMMWIESLLGSSLMPKDVYFIDHIPSIIDPLSVILVICISFVLGLMATIYPAWRAANVPPADALRYE